MTTTDRIDIMTSNVETSYPHRIPYFTGVKVEQAQVMLRCWRVRWGAANEMPGTRKVSLECGIWTYEFGGCRLVQFCDRRMKNTVGDVVFGFWREKWRKGEG